MALGKQRVTQRGYRTIYTVPAGKRAVVGVTAHALANSGIALVPTALGGAASSYDYVEPVTTVTVTGQRTTGPVFNGNRSSGQLGYSVDADGRYAVVGEPGRGSQVGRVHIYFYNGTAWTLQQTISDPQGNTNGYFGDSVAISGDHIIIGAPRDDTQTTDSGRAYRYTRSGTTWTQTAVYTNPNGSNSDYFGQGVAIAGDYIVIGSWGYSAGTVSVGRAYGYRVSTGTTLQVTFTSPTGTGVEFFGFSVACWADGRVLIGSHGFSSGSAVGRAYYYAAFANNLTSTINNPNGSNGDRFGYTVSCDKTGTFFAIGSEGFSSGNAVGRVYTYSTAAPTTILQTIDNPSGQSSSFFGTGLAMSSTGELLVGAYQFNAAQSDQGVAYHYTRSGNSWTLAQTLNNPSPGPSDYFGHAVAFTIGDVYEYRGLTLTTQSAGFLVGEYLNDPAGVNNAGSVHFYNPPSLSAAQKTTFEQQVDGFLTFQDVVSNATDVSSLPAKSTFERTGLVLDAGESVVIALPDAAGDVSVQVRGYEENV